MEEAKKILDPLALASIADAEFQHTLTPRPDIPKTPLQSEDELIKIDTVSEAEALQFLRITFSAVRERKLKEILKESEGNIRKAVDTLLNVEYLRSLHDAKAPCNGAAISDEDEDEAEDDRSIWTQNRPGGVSPQKAVPAFKGKAFPSLPPLSARKSPIGSQSQSQVQSRWAALDSQIVFLSKSLSIPSSKVRSAFHSNSSSLPRALKDLLKEIPNGHVDYNTLINLKQTFKHVEEDSLRKIIVGTGNNLDYVVELARILDHDKLFTATSVTPKVQLKPASKVRPISNLDLPSRSTNTLVDDGEGSYEEMNELKLHYLAKRNEAFNAASLAYRKSKSDSLRSGVAAYYGDLGREYNIKYRRYSQFAANRLVAVNSSINQLDLHGVGVKDAIRIVEEAVNAWWARVNVVRERGQIKAIENFVIVVGRGERQGRSVLGPPVAHWLRKNGWGFDETEGAFVVWGVRKQHG